MSNKIETFICIKEVLVDDFSEKYNLYFQIGKIYDFSVDNSYLYAFNHNTIYYLSHEEITNFFIPLEKWRKLRINKILEE